MSTMLEQVEAMLQRVIDERVTEARKAAWMQHNSVLMRSDAARTVAERERDAARAELAGVAAQRDAHLTRSVELTTRNAELEARLAAVAPAETAEVDGFRVGDLVRFNHETLPLLEVFHDETVGFAFGTVACDSPHRRKSCSQLQHMVRKPVEVGDTVRISPVASGYGRVWKVREITANGGGRSVAWFVGEGSARLDDCIAVAP